MITDMDETCLPTFLEVCKKNRNGGLASLSSEFTQDICNLIEVNTRGQALNQEWVNKRLGRITASIAYQVLHHKNLTPTHSLLKSILCHTNFSGNIHTKYGNALALVDKGKQC